MDDFFTGMFVRIKKPHPDGNRKINAGDIAIVVDLDNGENWCGLEFEKRVSSHSCSGHGRSGFCWYVRYSDIEPIDDGFAGASEEDLIGLFL